MKPSGQTHPYPQSSQGYQTPYGGPAAGQGQQYYAGQPASYATSGQSHQPGAQPYGQPAPSYGGAPAPQPPGPDPVGEGEMPMDNGKSDSPPEMVTPTAPPIQDMERIPGYDEVLAPNVTFVPPPPSYKEATSRTTIEQIASTRLTEEEARELLVDVAKSKCCWGKGAAESMIFKSLQQSTAVHYMLKTFLETRSTDWASEPFRGQLVDGPQNGRAPSPWEVHIQTPEMFNDSVFLTEVLHTASVRACHGCHGSAMIICRHCMGWGRNRCRWCHGSGHQGIGDSRRHCTSCHGSGRVHCYYCYGRGRIPCPTCEATGQVKCFIQMTITFTTHEKDFILERTSLPDHLIRDVLGTTLFEDTQPLLNPIQSFPEPQVNAQSASIIQEHRGLAQTGRIWMQNHVIRGVPVFQCDCQWKDNEFQFFVYGDDREVHTENYPQTCCCGCQLL